MVNCNFALGTYEMNLLSDNDFNYVIKKLLTKCEYIDTAINYNNDYLFAKQTNKKIISKIAPCHYDYYDFFIQNHLNYLNRKYIDIMLIHSPRGNWQRLLKRMMTDCRFTEIGVSNFNIEQLKEAKEILGNYPKYNEIEINPEYLDIDTINFCKKNNIKIIAYCILGGKYNAQRFIARYSLPHLMNFAANYADIVILRADNHKQTDSFIDVIENYTSNVIIEASNINNKSMQPMIYEIPKIFNYYNNMLTYHRDVGKNTGNFNIVKIIPFTFPKFEMLGDYLAYFRYIYNISNNVKYDNDLLYLYDNYYLQFYMIANGYLTKVNENAKCYLLILENCNEKF